MLAYRTKSIQENKEHAAQTRDSLRKGQTAWDFILSRHKACAVTKCACLWALYRRTAMSALWELAQTDSSECALRACTDGQLCVCSESCTDGQTTASRKRAKALLGIAAKRKNKVMCPKCNLPYKFFVPRPCQSLITYNYQDIFAQIVKTNPYRIK